MSQRYNDNIKKTQKAKVDRKSTKDLKDLSTLSENSVEGLRFRRVRFWGYVSIY